MFLKIINKKHKLEKELMLKYPKPITNEFLVIAKYNQMIEGMVEELVQEEIEEMLLKHIESDKKIYLVLTIDHPYA